MELTFIGDIHGDMKFYKKVTDKHDKTVQVGDFGVGFLSDNDSQLADEIQRTGRHRFIRGNHDNPHLVKSFSGYISDGFYDALDDIFYCGGAYSIDKDLRTPGYNWWPEEELNIDRMDVVKYTYQITCPEVMVTHDCPRDFATNFMLCGSSKSYPNRTSMFLDELLDFHSPELWIFGHWHKSKDIFYRGCRFVCLGINETITLEV